MNLVTRFLAARRDKLLMKLGCWLVCFSLVLGLMLPQQKAEALVTELAVGSVALIFLASTGYSWIVSGMNRAGLAESMDRQLQNFLDETHIGETVLTYFGDLASVAISVKSGTFRLSKHLVDKFTEFAEWFQGKFFADSDSAVVSSQNSGVSLKSGKMSLGSYVYTNGKNVVSFVVWSNNFNLGTLISLDSPFYIIDDIYLVFNYGLGVGSAGEGVNGYELIQHGPGSISRIMAHGANIDREKLQFSFCDVDGYLGIMSFTGFNFCTVTGNKTNTVILDTLEYAPASSLTAEKPKEIHYPDVAEDGSQAYDITVDGVTATDVEGIIQGAVDQILAGTAAIAGEVVQAQDVPAEEEITDVDNLGLPALGAALTSRFPFSIPWDFFRAVQLLAAPAKAPYFEVDFMEPLADEVGGWQGDTTVVLDFSEYAIIGQISRWTSTIGFCLMLAGATKRLIWTA